MSARFEITAGFMPLLDSALLVAAKAQGFAEEEGVELTLVRENSWANIRDRIAVGHFQVAHMLAPMPIAGNLGLTPLASRTIVPMAMGLGGNAVTVSDKLWARMLAQGAQANLDPIVNGTALAAAIHMDRQVKRLRFAVVHPHSCHNYELRYWLAASGADPESDIETVILPPPLMADALAGGTIDGYCVGEPWNTAAVALGIGHTATAKAAIWRSSPEKVLGAQARWAEENPESLAALLRAMYRAAVWCSRPDNRETLAALLAEPAYVGRPAAWMMPALTGDILLREGGEFHLDDFFVPFAKAATFPWKSHALWFYTQMARWGQIAHSREHEAIARETYRPDLYRSALKPLGVALPGANAKIEGALKQATPVGSSGASLTLGPDGFFDGGLFDPDQIEQYLQSQTPKPV